VRTREGSPELTLEMAANCLLNEKRIRLTHEDGKQGNTRLVNIIAVVNREIDKTSKIFRQLTVKMIPSKDNVDYSLYLVTDSGLLSPSAKSFEDHIEHLIEGGVTIVQLREKSLSTANFINRAQKLLDITRRRNIPLIINDRLDVALAIDADGLHVGQDDMGAHLFLI
jgi:Thiamine monophosphate synthase